MARVLIVDDVPETVELISIAVSPLGHQPIGTQSAQGALEELGHTLPDLILMDFMMPEKNGLEVLKRIRSLPQCESIPILFSTASSDVVLEEQVLAAGGNGVLRKPLGLTELDQAIKTYVPA
jgi:two-component system, OmpR family, phosphate regulon response regulator PhoB